MHRSTGPIFLRCLAQRLLLRPSSGATQPSWVPSCCCTAWPCGRCNKACCSARKKSWCPHAFWPSSSLHRPLRHHRPQHPSPWCSLPLPNPQNRRNHRPNQLLRHRPSPNLSPSHVRHPSPSLLQSLLRPPALLLFWPSLRPLILWPSLHHPHRHLPPQHRLRHLHPRPSCSRPQTRLT